MTGNDGHIPVLIDEVLAHLSPVDGQIYVDGTFGAGGYSKAILNAATCRVYAIDRDPDAIERGRRLAEGYDHRLVMVPGRFGDMDRLIPAAGARHVNGVALDLGVSSFQLDEAGRGFSFMKDGPLDMRMEREGESAADVVNSYSQQDLADIIHGYGEEPKARRIAGAIVSARSESPITRTLTLADIVISATGGRQRRSGKSVHPATRTFQALRIFVNRELEDLRRGLAAAERLLAPAGRLAVVAFHSLEDRIVKKFLAERSGRTPAPSRHLPIAQSDAPAPTFRLSKSGAIKPRPEEADRNPRARSARLRIAVRTEAPAWEMRA